MCVICDGNILEGEILAISDCNRVTTIPVINGLKRLYVTRCPNLRKNMNVELRILYIWNCPLDISNMKKLEGLCVGYWFRNSIPVIEGLRVLYCSNCPNLVKIRSRYLETINCYKCEKLRFIPNSAISEYSSCPVIGMSVVGSIFFRIVHFRF